MSIKRFVSALLTGALCLGVLTACGSTRFSAIGHRIVRRGVGKHARTARGKDLRTVFGTHRQHGVGQLAAQPAHVDMRLQIAGVEDHNMRHEFNFLFTVWRPWLQPHCPPMPAAPESHDHPAA